MGQRFKALFIEEGKSANGNYYSATVLKESVTKFKHGRSMYREHTDDKTLINLVGITVGNALYSKTHRGIVGEVLILDEGLLEMANNTPEKIHLSIDARVRRRIHNKEIIKIKKINSIDFVTEASAGGRLLCKNLKKETM